MAWFARYASSGQCVQRLSLQRARVCRSGATAERQLPGSASVPGVAVRVGMAILTQSMAPVLLVVGRGPLPVRHSTPPPVESQPCTQP